MPNNQINTHNSVLRCAFCVHWYDPSYLHIRPCPYDHFMKMWEFDKGVKSYCSTTRRQMYSDSISCHHFEKKELKF